MRTMALLGLTTALGAGWPSWLGPQRDGQVGQVGVVKALQAGSPQELWRRAPGVGYSGVAIADGLVVTMADDDTGAWAVAMDAATGADRWRTRVDAPYKDGMGYNGPRATPTLADGRVVTVSGNGVLTVLDAATGVAAWSVDLVGALTGARPKWGYSGSPLVSDGVVYVAVGGADPNGAVAFDLATGARRWGHGAWGAAYSSPVRATLGGVDQVVFFTEDGPVGLRPDTGALVWSHPWSTQYGVNAATPLVVGTDRLFVASGYGSGGALLEVGAAGAKEVWRSKAMKNKLATSVRVGEHLYGFDEDRLAAISLTTGEQTWNERGYGRGTLLAVDGALLVLSESCQLSVVAADPAGHRVVAGPFKVLASEPCWTVPSVADGVIYLRDNAHLVAVAAR